METTQLLQRSVNCDSFQQVCCVTSTNEMNDCRSAFFKFAGRDELHGTCTKRQIRAFWNERSNNSVPERPTDGMRTARNSPWHTPQKEGGGFYLFTKDMYYHRDSSNANSPSSGTNFTK